MSTKELFVGGLSLCDQHGYTNSSDGLCVCHDGFYGWDCQFKFCPGGKSWLAIPKISHERNREYSECSDMGFCDIYSGKCSCRAGYEGLACERLSCPSSIYQPPKYNFQGGLYIEGISTVVNIPHAIALEANFNNTDTVRTCSGHGRCKTLREAGQEFNGLTLINPKVQYNNWDADAIQGCVCDIGWNGYDCSYRTCPMGRDPIDLASAAQIDEKIVLQCQADSGFFTMLVLGQYTPPIPFDADPAYLKYALESIYLTGGVTVTMETDTYGLPSVCSQTYILTTTIVLNDYYSPNSGRENHAPVYVTRLSSNTRQWPNGDVPLSLSGASAVLRLVTNYHLYCGVCPHCHGKMFFTFRDSVSSGVNITTAGAAAAIESAIIAMTDLTDMGWSSLSVNITGPDVVCSKTASSLLTISLYSDYGNIAGLNIIDATEAGLANLTWATNLGTAKLYECSNQGTCDRRSGKCNCISSYQYGKLQYHATSSNGKGSPGPIEDCGFLKFDPDSCFIGGKHLCNGHGVCSNTTMSCTCFDGWMGATCAVRNCPKGRALFDEPVSGTVAHSLLECSGQGVCNRTVGVCHCRAGHNGPACDKIDCYRDPFTGVECSGRGECLSISKMFSNYNLAYGDRGNNRTYPATWDRDLWHECVCAAKTSSGFFGNPNKPAVGPTGYVSGIVAQSTPLPGWRGFDCSQFNCPKGDNVGKRHNYGGAFETQEVLCLLPEEDSFTVQVLGQTIYLHGSMSVMDIKYAFELPAQIGNVSVWFTNASYVNYTACNPLYSSHGGGFVVQFDTELGNLALMTSTASSVYIYGITDGSKVNEECGGPAMGVCDRSVGLCKCAPYQASSNNSNAPGSTGNCGWRSDYLLQPRTPRPADNDMGNVGMDISSTGGPGGFF